MHSKNLIITNAWFQEYPRHLWTWRSLGGNMKNQNDYITMKDSRMECYTAKYPSANCQNDHISVIMQTWNKILEIKENQCLKFNMPTPS